MASFRRADYEAVFRSAVKIWINSDYGTVAEAEAVKIMDLCEEVIGQQHRPDHLTSTE